MPRRFWTAEEDAVITSTYTKRRGPARCVAALEGRSLYAVRERAKRILPRSRRHAHWTSGEDRVLTACWGDSPRVLRAKLPGRSWLACAQRARVLGLPCVRRMTGTVPMAEAARLSGYAYETLARILEEEGVRVEYYYGGHGIADVRQAKRPHRAVDVEEMTAAIERRIRREAAQETLSEAAARIGADRKSLKLALVNAGLAVGRARAWKLDPSAVDEAWRNQKAARREVAA